MTSRIIPYKANPPASQAFRPAGRLGLAASPVFALMAVVTAIRTPPMTICSALPGPLPIDGMTLMYLLMAVFHAHPWLRLIGRAEQHHHDPHRG